MQPNQHHFFDLLLPYTSKFNYNSPNDRGKNASHSVFLYLFLPWTCDWRDFSSNHCVGWEIWQRANLASPNYLVMPLQRCALHLSTSQQLLLLKFSSGKNSDIFYCFYVMYVVFRLICLLIRVLYQTLFDILSLILRRYLCYCMCSSTGQRKLVDLSSSEYVLVFINLISNHQICFGWLSDNSLSSYVHGRKM